MMHQPKPFKFSRLIPLFMLLLIGLLANCAPSAPEEIAAVPARRGGPEVVGQIQEITFEILGVDMDAVTPESDFREDFGADDEAMAELAAEFELAFGVEISDAEIDALTTVQSAADLIASKQ